MLPRTLTFARRHAAPMAIGATFALIVGGTSAVAATVITSRQIKDGTIRNVDIAKSTITADRLTAGARTSLKGQRGAAGPAGARGLQGLQGLQGPQGVPGEDGQGSVPDPGEVYKWVMSYDEDPENLTSVAVTSANELPVGSIIQPLGIDILPGADFSRCNNGPFGEGSGIGFLSGTGLGIAWDPETGTFSPGGEYERDPGRKSDPLVRPTKLRAQITCSASAPPPEGSIDPEYVRVPVPSVQAVFYYRVFHEDPVLAFDKATAKSFE